MKTIPLTQGLSATVDDQDYDRVKQYKWWTMRVGRNTYGLRTLPGTGKKELLHRFILQPDPKQLIDHIDGNGLNCQRKNMRIATQRQNQQNQKLRSSNTSGYKGVCLAWDGIQWVARIRDSFGKKTHLGLFPDAVSAAKAYDRAARKYHGEFANTNF